MAFVLVKNSLGDFDLFVNGFHMPNFSVQRDYFRLQKWEEQGKVEIYDFNAYEESKTNNYDEPNEKLLQAIGKIVRGEYNDDESDIE